MEVFQILVVTMTLKNPQQLAHVGSKYWRDRASLTHKANLELLAKRICRQLQSLNHKTMDFSLGVRINPRQQLIDLSRKPPKDQVLMGEPSIQTKVKSLLQETGQTQIERFSWEGITNPCEVG